MDKEFCIVSRYSRTHHGHEHVLVQDLPDLGLLQVPVLVDGEAERVASLLHWSLKP